MGGSIKVHDLGHVGIQVINPQVIPVVIHIAGAELAGIGPRKPVPHDPNRKVGKVRAGLGDINACRRAIGVQIIKLGPWIMRN